MKTKRSAVDWFLTGLLAVASVLYVYPIFMILINSLKQERAIGTATVFELPTGDTFAGLENFVNAVASKGFMESLFYSTFITITSVAAILICCSMCAWFITRVKNKFIQSLYYLFVFSMVVPFQMVMFTLSQTADKLNLNTPWNIWIIYLGFGAGLAVFMFTGFMKSIPLEIEEAAMIDGCNPLQTFFGVVFPILKPTAITVAILNAMWIWNDYLLPLLVLGTDSKTVPVAIQIAMQGAYGSTDMGGFMAMLVLAIIPIIIFYVACQKHIIKGVIAGAVKG